MLIIYSYMNMTYSYGLPWFGIWINSCFSQHAETLRQPYNVSFPPCHVLSEASHVRRGCILTKAFYSDLQPSLLFARFRRMPTNQWYTNINDSFPDQKTSSPRCKWTACKGSNDCKSPVKRKGFGNGKQPWDQVQTAFIFFPHSGGEWFIYRFNHSDSNMPKL